MTKSLVIGATGQDGTLLMNELALSGYTVLGTSRGESSSSNIVKLDLTDAIAVSNLLYDYMPDEIYILAGQSSVGHSFNHFWETLQSFTLPAINVFEGCLKANILPRILVPLSSEMFGENASLGATEETKFDLLSPYAFSKKTCYDICEYYKQHFKMDIVFVYLFNHESHLRPINYVTAKIAQGAVACAKGDSRKLELGNIQIYRDWGWAPEYVVAMKLALEKGTFDSYVVSTGVCYSLEEFVKSCFECVSLDYKDYLFISRSLYRPADIGRNYGIPERAETDLGWVAKKKMPEVAQSLVRHFMNDKAR